MQCYTSARFRPGPGHVHITDRNVAVDARLAPSVRIRVRVRARARARVRVRVRWMP